ncbi:IS1 family transposase [Ammoniphilus sp. CFH 90114]|nr:IS1 family transposase [Ammoniphilus sp. CFH 90114]
MSKKLRETYRRFMDADTCQVVLGQVKEQRQTSISCPHCESPIIVRYGKYRDRQRYKCKECDRTFNDFTNTPLHGTHFPDKWIKFLECMIEGHSLQLSALILGVSYVTLFYWRHKIIHALQKLESIEQRDYKPLDYGLSKKYIWVYHYPPYSVVPYADRRAFVNWIERFIGLAQKYLGRYVAWFNSLKKVKQEKKMQLDAMSSMLLKACSLSLKQTYINLRKVEGCA